MRGLRGTLLTFLSGVVVGAGAFWLFLLGPLIFPGTATVIDGDSLKIAGYNLRLAGLNAPELPIIDGRQCRKHNLENGCHNGSSLALVDFVEGKVVFCLLAGFDWHYWRPVVVCQANGIEINRWLIKHCHADPPKNKAHRIPGYDGLFAARRCRNPNDAGQP